MKPWNMMMMMKAPLTDLALFLYTLSYCEWINAIFHLIVLASNQKRHEYNQTRGFLCLRSLKSTPSLPKPKMCFCVLVGLDIYSHLGPHIYVRSTSSTFVHIGLILRLANHMCLLWCHRFYYVSLEAAFH